MTMRITTNGAIYSYKSNLMRSYSTLNLASDKVLTQRNFNSYAEDPASASQSFQLRRNMWRTDAQLTNSNTITNKFSTAWSAIDVIANDIGNDMASVSALSAISDATGAGRNALGQLLVSSANAVLQSMNVKYGDDFIFAGADGVNVPFSWSETGELLYRGVSVDSAEGTDEYNTLENMNSEKVFIDLGLGLTEDADGNLIESSAFNSSLSGIDFLGYGIDADGDPKNVISIMKQLGELFSNCDTTTGEYANESDRETANRLTGKLQTALRNLTVKQTELDVQSTSLNTNTSRLEDLKATLNEQIISIEQINEADAIMSLSWAQTCYNAALKIGNSIISQSLLDYMR